MSSRRFNGELGETGHEYGACSALYRRPSRVLQHRVRHQPWDSFVLKLLRLRPMIRVTGHEHKPGVKIGTEFLGLGVVSAGNDGRLDRIACLAEELRPQPSSLKAQSMLHCASPRCR
jgi:hypothetical protein